MNPEIVIVDTLPETDSAEIPAWFADEFTALLATYTPGDDLAPTVLDLWLLVG